MGVTLQGVSDGQYGWELVMGVILEGVSGETSVLFSMLLFVGGQILFCHLKMSCMLNAFLRQGCIMSLSREVTCNTPRLHHVL